MSRPILICDIDGVIADLSHRLHLIAQTPPKWDEFFEACSGDMPMPQTIFFLKYVAKACDIVFLTGRPERVRMKTVAWFGEHQLPAGLLYMRKDGDHREDFEVKWELFEKNVNPARVLAVLEDRDQVVEMWREKGLLCFQNKKGDY